MDYTNPEIAELRQKFLMLDTDGDQYITKQQLKVFMTQQLGPLQPSIWQTNNMMLSMKDGKYISQADFIVWILGCRLKLQGLAIMKFNMKKSLTKYQSASPPQLEAVLKKSFLDIKISNQKIKQEELHKIQLSVGFDKQNQSKKRELISKGMRQSILVLGRDPSNIYILLKFKCHQNGEQIALKLSEALQTIIGFATQMVPQFESLLSSLEINVKNFQGDIYIIGQLSHTFFDCIVQFMEQASLTLSPECKMLFKLMIKSNVSKILKQDITLDGHSAQIKAQFDIDSISLCKLKQIIAQEQNELSPDQKFTAMLLLLLQQIRLSTQFSNIKQFLIQMGVNQSDIPKPNQQVQVIKEMGIKDILNEFIQGSAQIIQSIQKSCKSEGQLSINLSSFAIKIDFDIQIAGAFDIL